MAQFPSPQGPNLTGSIRRTSQYAIGHGAFTDVYEGEWRRPGFHPMVVAIKIFRGVHTEPEKYQHMMRRLLRECRVWHMLSHPNVQSYYGWCDSRDVGPSIGLISPFARNGTMVKFLQRKPEFDRFQLILDIASGLKYLHDNGIIHGDLHGNNVLINDFENACLSDFGRARIIGHEGYSTALNAGCTVFMAPELNPEEDDETPAFSLMSDVYAFAMFSFEIMTGCFPLCPPGRPTPPPYLIIKRVHEGKRPERWYDVNRCISNPLWLWLEAGWRGTPTARPTMAQILLALPGCR
ncbi:kinase-like domain-containing protein [Crucibulum laeve]|uniref:Kinase-like domain-containing protein n=1 Tax=Crucibulum laeve TaxID=68775 RepID=A0A5C3LZ44_9AGAR|nr:kinase-like domain-containing protein [Crucibulum laeve]